MRTKNVGPNGVDDVQEEAVDDPYSEEILAMLMEDIDAGASGVKDDFKKTMSTPEEQRNPKNTNQEHASVPGARREILAFDRGDEVELAQRLAVDLRGDSPHEVVFDEGSFWRYDAGRGIFVEVSVVEARNLVTGYAGSPIFTGRRMSPLCISRNKLVGAVKIAAEALAAKDFFRNAPPGVAFRNAFVRINESGIAPVPHSPTYRARHAFDVDYDPTEPCPRWCAFLREVFPPIEDEDASAIDDAEERIALLQEFAGAALFGLATQHAKALVMVGEGSNGKSVVTKIISAMFPPAAVSSIGPQEWTRGFSLAELVGKRLNSIAELPARNIGESDRFKAVVSGDSVMAERKFEQGFRFTPTAAHLFACNALPASQDHSEGYWRRFMVLVFNRAFAPHEQDHQLSKKLLAELPGIVSWAIEGAKRLHTRGGFVVPESSKSAQREWRDSTDQVRAFAKELLVDTRDHGANRSAVNGHVPCMTTSVQHLYERYTTWAVSNGHHPVACVEFGRRMKRMFKCGRNSSTRFYHVVFQDESGGVPEMDNDI